MKTAQTTSSLGVPTPTPWYARDYDEQSGYGDSTNWAGSQIMGGDEDFVLATLNRDGPNDAANAELIIRAVNNHQRLVDALELILPLARGYRPEGQTDTARATCKSWVAAAEEALSQASGGER